MYALMVNSSDVLILFFFPHQSSEDQLIPTSSTEMLLVTEPTSTDFTKPQQHK